MDDTPVDCRNSLREQFDDDIPSRRSTFHDSGGSYDGDNYSEEELLRGKIKKQWKTIEQRSLETHVKK